MKTGMALVASIILMGCSTMKYYPTVKITLQEITKNNSVLSVYYSVPLETMYYSSGIDFVYNKDCNQVVIKVVRQRINTNPKVMLQSVLSRDVVDSTKLKEFGINSYMVEIPIEEHWNLNNACNKEIVKTAD